MTLRGIESGRDGPAIVFLHGVGSDATAWEDQLEVFAADHRCLALDMPGYRASPASPAQDAAAVARLVLDRVASFAPGKDRMHLVGLSLGVVVAAHVAAMAPGKVASLVLASGFLAYPEGRAVAARAQQAAAAGMAALAASRVDRIVHANTPAATRLRVVTAMSAIPVEAYARMAHAVWTADLTQVAARLQAPTLVVNGEEDPITPPALGRQLAGTINGARLATIQQASHLVNLDQPEAFDQLLRDHLQELA